MSSQRQVTDPRAGAIPLLPAFVGWAAAWIVGSLLFAPIVLVAFGVDSGDELTVVQLSVATAATWAAFLVALAALSRKYGTGDPVADYAVRFRPIDLVAAPVGVLTQLAIIPALYLPLQEWWPDTFTDERLEERARDLVDRADGASILLLFLVVAVGAPIVEELVYRGLVQRSLMRAAGVWPGLVVGSLWFALVHPVPVEYPGLFVAGLAFGGCVAVTGRVGPAIVAHAAFNAAGLVVATQAT